MLNASKKSSSQRRAYCEAVASDSHVGGTWGQTPPCHGRAKVASVVIPKARRPGEPTKESTTSIIQVASDGGDGLSCLICQPMTLLGSLLTGFPMLAPSILVCSCGSSAQASSLATRPAGLCDLLHAETAYYVASRSGSPIEA